MINIILLDTNIYRQLGLKFYDHIDYKGLGDYCYSSASEILISNIVYKEYLDYYTKEVLDKNLADIGKAYKRLGKLQSFEGLQPPDLTEARLKELELIKTKLSGYKLRQRTNHFLNEETLLNFLIDNKQDNKKDNTRDFLIWLNALSASKDYPNDQVVLISEDSIFYENDHLKSLQKTLVEKEVKVFKSISSFLSVFGFKSEILTKSYILHNISIDAIKEELLKHKDAVPSHISRFYHNSTEKFNIEKFEIDDVRVQEFYSHKDHETNEVKIIAHIEVKVNMVFEPEKDISDLREYLADEHFNSQIYMETFDNRGAPVFHDWMLFHFEMAFSEKTQSITRSDLLDFFIEHYQTARYRNLFSDFN